jgi:hypothetical protein
VQGQALAFNSCTAVTAVEQLPPHLVGGVHGDGVRAGHGAGVDAGRDDHVRVLRGVAVTSCMGKHICWKPGSHVGQGAGSNPKPGCFQAQGGQLCSACAAAPG